MTLKRERLRPVDWAEEAKIAVHKESWQWDKTVSTAVMRRWLLFIYFEENIPAKNGKRDQWTKLDWYIKGKKIPWAPRGFLG